MKTLKEIFQKIREEAPANATGPAIPGSGDTGEAFVSQAAQRRHTRRNRSERTSSILRRLMPKKVGM